MDESDVKSMLTYVKASEIAEKLNHQNKMIDILRLDLLGGEWDVLESLVSSQLIEVKFGNGDWLKIEVLKKICICHIVTCRITIRSSSLYMYGMGKKCSVWSIGSWDFKNS